MYNTQDIAIRIKQLAKSKGIPLKDMLSDLQMGINVIAHLSKGQQISYLAFCKFADYLDCSVDYLLGRTDNPNAHKKERPVLSIENEPRYRVRFAGRDGSVGEKFLTKEEIEQLQSLPDADDL